MKCSRRPAQGIAPPVLLDQRHALALDNLADACQFQGIDRVLCDARRGRTDRPPGAVRSLRRRSRRATGACGDCAWPPPRRPRTRGSPRPRSRRPLRSRGTGDSGRSKGRRTGRSSRGARRRRRACGPRQRAARTRGAAEQRPPSVPVTKRKSPGFAHVAADGLHARRPGDQGRADRQGLVPPRDVAADDRAGELRGRLVQALAQFFGELHVAAFGRATHATAQTGLAAIAAASERLTASALYPTWRGVACSRSKCVPSSRASTVKAPRLAAQADLGHVVAPADRESLRIEGDLAADPLNKGPLALEFPLRVRSWHRPLLEEFGQDLERRVPRLRIVCSRARARDIPTVAGRRNRGTQFLLEEFGQDLEGLLGDLSRLGLVRVELHRDPSPVTDVVEGPKDLPVIDRPTAGHEVPVLAAGRCPQGARGGCGRESPGRIRRVHPHAIEVADVEVQGQSRMRETFKEFLELLGTLDEKVRLGLHEEVHAALVGQRQDLRGDPGGKGPSRRRVRARRAAGRRVPG